MFAGLTGFSATEAQGTMLGGLCWVMPGGLVVTSGGDACKKASDLCHRGQFLVFCSRGSGVTCPMCPFLGRVLSCVWQCDTSQANVKRTCLFPFTFLAVQSQATLYLSPTKKWLKCALNALNTATRSPWQKPCKLIHLVRDQCK